jgi:hypothetical protein
MRPGRVSIQYRREAEERSLGSSSCSVCLNLKLHRRICFVLFELNENCSPSRTNESINRKKRSFTVQYVRLPALYAILECDTTDWTPTVQHAYIFIFLSLLFPMKTLQRQEP